MPLDGGDLVDEPLLAEDEFQLLVNGGDDLGLEEHGPKCTEIDTKPVTGIRLCYGHLWVGVGFQ